MINGISSIGFDLDNTLYKQNEEVNDEIRRYACQRASEILGRSYDEIRAEFDKIYRRIHSGRQSLEEMGIPNGKALIQEAIENVDIIPFLNEDPKLRGMIERLSKRFKLFLITGSARASAIKKLEKLGINRTIFDPRIYAESPYERGDGSAFRHVSETHGTIFTNMMFIGDREEADIIPARNLGITTAIVNNNSEHADYNLENIYKLEELLL